MRTTAEAVKGIIEVDTVSVPDLTPFLTVASELVTELCLASGYSEERLELIERWLAAHFYAIRDPRKASESVGLSATYQYQLGLNLAVTTYGQQAMLLDTQKSLAKLNADVGKGAQPSVGVFWLGTPR